MFVKLQQGFFEAGLKSEKDDIFDLFTSVPQEPAASPIRPNMIFGKDTSRFLGLAYFQQSVCNTPTIPLRAIDCLF